MPTYIVLLIVAAHFSWVSGTVVPLTASEPDDEVGCFTPETLDLMLGEYRQDAARHGIEVAACFDRRMAEFAERNVAAQERLSSDENVVCAKRSEIQQEMESCRSESRDIEVAEYPHDATLATAFEASLSHTDRRIGFRGTKLSFCDGKHACCRLRTQGIIALRRCFEPKCWKWKCD